MSRFPAARAAMAFIAVLALGTPSGTVLAASTEAPAGCSNTSTGFAALTDLGTGTYQGEQGGLYPGGSNTPPGAYRAAGIQAARSMGPLDTSGNPSAAGKIVFLALGMSNTNLEFGAFMDREANNSQRNPAVTLVNGSQDGQDASSWASADSPTWGVVDGMLSASGVSAKQVEVVWLKQADVAFPMPDFQTYAKTLQREMSTMVTIAAQRYPNLREVFVSPRTYGGYAGISTQGLNPEPWAYETGFADKWLVAQSVANPNQRPWIGWGPYWWTDGTRGRGDGFKWECGDTASDFTHLSPEGLAKTTSALHSTFTTSVFASWFTGSTPVQDPVPGPPQQPGPVAQPIPTPEASGNPAATPQGSDSTSPSAGATPEATPGSSPITVPALASRPEQRELLIVLGVLLLAALIVGFAYLAAVRRRPPIVTRPHAPTGNGQTSVPVPDAPPIPDAEGAAPEPPVLAGVSHELDAAGAAEPKGRP